VADAARRARVEELLEAARVLADPTTAPSQRLRARVREASGLSRESVDVALERCLEQRASADELTRLLARTPEALRGLVLLSANVFVAPLRAIALARASSARVIVRPSRRDPALAEALSELLPGAFQLVSELRPEPGDHVWAYGANETLATVRDSLPLGVTFHGHGFGLGAVVLESGFDVPQSAKAIALDAALFDQRGCLSPRLVVVAGRAEEAAQLAQALAAELEQLERTLPPGSETPEQSAERRRQGDAATYAFDVLPAGRGWVSFSAEGRSSLPPAARCLHVLRAPEPIAALAAFASHLTCLSSTAGSALGQALRAAFPGARHCGLGEMQTPPLDGPVDLRGLER
jgi:hypothetical protein